MLNFQPGQLAKDPNPPRAFKRVDIPYWTRARNIYSENRQNGAAKITAIQHHFIRSLKM